MIALHIVQADLVDYQDIASIVGFSSVLQEEADNGPCSERPLKLVRIHMHLFCNETRTKIEMLIHKFLKNSGFLSMKIISSQDHLIIFFPKLF